MSEGYISCSALFSSASHPSRAFAVLVQTPMLRLSVAKRWAVILWRQEWRGKRRVQFFLSPCSVYFPSVSVPGCSHPPPHACSVQPPSPQGAPTDWGYGWSFAQIYACICFHSFSRVCGEGASSPFEYNTLTEMGRGLSTFPPHTVLALQRNQWDSEYRFSLKRMSRGGGGAGSSRKHGEGPILYKGEEKY